MTDSLSYTVSICPEFFSVYCDERRHFELGDPITDSEGYTRRPGRYVSDGPGCGYLDRNAKPSAKVVYMSREDARRVAARHRRMHRGQLSPREVAS